MASVPIRILLLGNAKMGTTGVFNSIKMGMAKAHPDRSPILVSEPAASVASALNRYGRDHDALVKAMINKTGTRVRVDGYSHTVLIVRDPRDTVVSQLLYYPLQPYGMRRTSAVDLERYLAALRDKERDPSSWSLRALFELAVETMEWEPEWSWDRYDVRFKDSLAYARENPFVLAYEDFVDGRLDKLSAYLAFPIQNIHVESASRTGHVIRSSGYGDWRQWFTTEDVEFFRPRWKNYMDEFGYTDWELDRQPHVDPATASEYVVRKREKVELTLRERLVDVSKWDPTELTDADILRRIEEAAEDGGGGSLYRLARLYHEGGPLAVPEPSRARELAERGAILGNVECMVLLARMLRQGVGGAVESDAAWFWLQEAHEIGQRRIESLSTKLSQATDTLRRHYRGTPVPTVANSNTSAAGTSPTAGPAVDRHRETADESRTHRQRTRTPAYRIAHAAMRVWQHPRGALLALYYRVRSVVLGNGSTTRARTPHSRTPSGPRLLGTSDQPGPTSNVEAATGYPPAEQGSRVVTSPTRQFAVPVPGTDDRYIGFDVSPKLWVPRVVSDQGLPGYEFDTISAFLALLDICPDGPVIDVGANVGMFALLAASSAPDRSVHAFEPTPELARVVRDTAKANGLAVGVQEAAAGAEDGTALLYLSNTTDASNSLREGFRDAVGTTQVAVRSLDRWCRETGTLPSVVKIDTETTEPDVIRGFMEVIGEARPYIICEVLPRATETELEQLVVELGYHAYQITNDLPLVKRREIFGDRTFTYRDWIFSPEPLDADFHTAYRRRRKEVGASRPPAPYIRPRVMDWPGLRFGSSERFHERWQEVASMTGIDATTNVEGSVLDLRAAFPPGQSRYLSHGSYDFAVPPSDAGDWPVNPDTEFSLVCPYTHVNGTVVVDAYLIGYRGQKRSTHMSMRLVNGINTLTWRPDGTSSVLRLAFRVAGRGRCYLGPLTAYRALDT